MPMKVNGVENVREITYGPIVFKRGDNFLVFTVQPVWNMAEFDKLCPFPENKNFYFTKDKGKVEDYECSAWKETEAEYWRQRWGYIVLKSLEPSNVEIDGISLSEPKTWGSVEHSLREELNPQEFSRLMALVEEANTLDARKLEANKLTFFERQKTENSLPENSSSSEPATDSE